MIDSCSMGVEKLVIKPGNGIDYPKKHDEVSMEYTGKTSVSPNINI
jgi:FKBP-type peptidyl-prolyl cis-trans isomerase